ncbi:MAG: peptide chain release factor N(5)-glutamine methyltransferase [Actinomycetota bacterium]|nr:peptide chain release factor N(5)-glutamine methyltransferase [Actinomycetota bacterium]
MADRTANSRRARVAEILAGATVDIGPREADWIVEEAADDEAALAMARRRAAGEPLQYILGSAHFRDLRLVVQPDVLIPRPETEVLVERALAHLPQNGIAADIGTGCGAIGLSIAHERPDATVLATDLSEPAVACARQNAAIIGVDVEFYIGDLFAALPHGWRGTLDLVVSNPPYVADSDRAFLSPDIVQHEPHVALFAGVDGLDVTRRLVADARGWLKPGGWLVFEISEFSGDRVKELLTSWGYADVDVHPDLGGRDRMAEGRR